MKISIIVDRSLKVGQKANVAAIIMGQLAQNRNMLYEDPIKDTSGVKHAGISVNVVILDGGNGQMLTLIENAQKCDVTSIVFSAIGQSFSNNFPKYRQQISLLSTKETNIIGVGIVGEDNVVISLTKKFSLTK